MIPIGAAIARINLSTLMVANKAMHAGTYGTLVRRCGAVRSTLRLPAAGCGAWIGKIILKL
jgi:hypothetical protein